MVPRTPEFLGRPHRGKGQKLVTIKLGTIWNMGTIWYVVFNYHDAIINNGKKKS